MTVALVELPGRPLAEAVKERVTIAAAGLRDRGIVPRMAAILASEDAAARSYAESKQRAAAKLGIDLDVVDVGARLSQAEFETAIAAQFQGYHLGTSLQQRQSTWLGLGKTRQPLSLGQVRQNDIDYRQQGTHLVQCSLRNRHPWIESHGQAMATGYLQTQERSTALGFSQQGISR